MTRTTTNSPMPMPNTGDDHRSASHQPQRLVILRVGPHSRTSGDGLTGGGASFPTSSGAWFGGFGGMVGGGFGHEVTTTSARERRIRRSMCP